MPWNAQSFKKHNHSLDTKQSGKAAEQANAILDKTGDEGLAISVANKNAKKKSMKDKMYSRKEK